MFLLRQLGAKAKGQFRELGEKAAEQTNACWCFVGADALWTPWLGDALLRPAEEPCMGSVHNREAGAPRVAW